LSCLLCILDPPRYLQLPGFVSSPFSSLQTDCRETSYREESVAPLRTCASCHGAALPRLLQLSRPPTREEGEQGKRRS
jgi:hypothetical protein